MNIKQLSVAAAVSALTFTTATNAVLGPIPIYLNPVKIGSNYFNDLDTKATFASEVYTAEDIKNSNTNTIEDFLNQNTSISLVPSSGNKFSQLIQTRGFSTSDSHQYIAITVDGRRLNRIHTTPQALGSILLSNIKRIEITSGSGSVIHGDGAVAGSINIYTKNPTETSIKFSLGNYGVVERAISTGYVGEKFEISLTDDLYTNTGYSNPDVTNNKDKGERLNQQLRLKFSPNFSNDIALNISQSDTDNRYANVQSRDEFNANPAQDGDPGNKYTHATSDTQIIDIKIKTKISDYLSTEINLSNEDKNTDTVWYYDQAKYTHNNKIANAHLTYQKGNLKIDSGYDIYLGNRSKTFAANNQNTLNNVDKTNKGVFINLSKILNNNTYTLGARKESSKYSYTKTLDGVVQNKDFDLEAYNAGINHKLDENISLFSNYNIGFLTPPIDYLFDYLGVFNGFIEPVKSKTLNIGLNHLTDKSKTKITLYRSDLKNEFYLEGGWNNRNINESHKFGLELQHRHHLNHKTNINLNYSYTEAIVDVESATIEGKNIPLAPKNTASVTLNHKLTDKSDITISHKYRDSTPNDSDQDNTSNYKQKAFNNTSIAYLYKYNKDLDLSFNVDNVFEESYGYQTYDNSIYPVSFTRNIKAGLTYRF